MVPKAKQAPPELAVVGRRQKRLDGFEKVSGRSVFTDDVRLPGMLHGKILRSPHARARIVSIDTSKAAALPGVKIVLTGEDAPDLMFSEHQPVFARKVVTIVTLVDVPVVVDRVVLALGEDQLPPLGGIDRRVGRVTVVVGVGAHDGVSGLTSKLL